MGEAREGGDAIDSFREVCVETTSRKELDGQLNVIPFKTSALGNDKKKTPDRAEL